jgi:hypothetical protein
MECYYFIINVDDRKQWCFVFVFRRIFYYFYFYFHFISTNSSYMANSCDNSK